MIHGGRALQISNPITTLSIEKDCACANINQMQIVVMASTVHGQSKQRRDSRSWETWGSIQSKKQAGTRSMQN